MRSQKVRRNTALMIFGSTFLLLLCLGALLLRNKTNVILFRSALTEQRFGNFTFLIHDNSAVVVKYHGSNSTVSIPSNINNIPVVFIGRGIAVPLPDDGSAPCSMGVFSDCISLTNVTIPDSVTAIGDYAFWSSGLTKVTIPDSITAIGEYAFAACVNLTNVTVGSNVIGIGTGAFQDCRNLTDITIPDSVVALGYWAFQGCTNLTTAIIGNNVSSVGEMAFQGCTALKDINIPDSVVTIGNSAFQDCFSLTNAILGNNVATVGERAFANCYSLLNVKIGNSVTNIGEFAFAGCTSLNKADFPTIIQSAITVDNAFPFHKTFEFITVPDNADIVGDIREQFRLIPKKEAEGPRRDMRLR